jgi:DNA gyrase/topoisomerase IV subunit A
VIDWWNRQGAIRTKDVKRYQNIIKRYRKDMAYYRSHIKQLNNEYADARKTMTSEAFWLDYLGMNNG